MNTSVPLGFTTLLSSALHRLQFLEKSVWNLRLPLTLLQVSSDNVPTNKVKVKLESLGVLLEVKLNRVTHCIRHRTGIFDGRLGIRILHGRLSIGILHGRLGIGILHGRLGIGILLGRLGIGILLGRLGIGILAGRLGRGVLDGRLG